MPLFKKKAIAALVATLSLAGCNDSAKDPFGSSVDPTPLGPSTLISKFISDPAVIVKRVYRADQVNAAGDTGTVSLAVDLSSFLINPTPAVPESGADARADNDYVIKDVTLALGSTSVATAPASDGKSFTFDVPANAYGNYEGTVTFTRLSHEDVDGNGALDDQVDQQISIVIPYSSGISSLVTVPVISKNIGAGAPATINLAESSTISELLNAGYTLEGVIKDDNSSLSVSTGSDGKSIDVLSSGPGSALITYELVQKVDDVIKDVLVGSINVAASNEASAVSGLSGDLSAQLSDVQTGKVISTVGISDNTAKMYLQSVTSPNGGTITFGNTNTPLDDAAIKANTLFTFTGNQTGIYPIAYTLTDGEGNYFAGNVTLNVGDMTVTQPNGRMPEWVVVEDELGHLLKITKPLLLQDVQDRDPAFPDNLSTENVTPAGNGKWVSTNAKNGKGACEAFDQQVITLTAYKTLLAKLGGNPNAILSWPKDKNDNKGILVQDTSFLESFSEYTAATNTVKYDDGKAFPGTASYEFALLLCGSPVSGSDNVGAMITVPTLGDTSVTPYQVSADLINGNVNRIELSNIANTGTFQCTSSDPAIADAVCTTPVNGMATLYTVWKGTGDATITVNTGKGEYLLGDAPSLTVQMNNDTAIATGIPSITSFTINANVPTSLDDPTLTDLPIYDLTNGVIKENLKRVRPGTQLTINAQADDPDVGQEPSIAYEVVNTTGVSGGVSTVEDFGLVTIKAMPTTGSGAETEEGIPVKVTLDITNDAPSITIGGDGLTVSIAPEGSIANAFTDNANLTIDSYTGSYTDPNNDTEKESLLTWQHKSPYASDWTKLSGETSETLSPDALASFFVGGVNAGNDLRASVTPVDFYDKAGTAVSSNVMYPTASDADSVTQADIVVRDSTEATPLILKGGENFTTTDNFVRSNDHGNQNGSDNRYYDRLCQKIVTPTDGYPNTSVKAARVASIDALKRSGLPPLKYFSKTFAERPNLVLMTPAGWTNKVYGPPPSNTSTCGDCGYTSMPELWNNLTDQTTLFNFTPNTSPTNDRTLQEPSRSLVINTAYLQCEQSSDVLVLGDTVNWIATINGPFTSASTAVGNGDISVASSPEGYFTSPVSKATADIFGLALSVSGTEKNTYQSTGIYNPGANDGGSAVGNNPAPNTNAEYVLFSNKARIQDACDNLNARKFGGRTDWQVPTAQQLQRFADFQGEKYYPTDVSNGLTKGLQWPLYTPNYPAGTTVCDGLHVLGGPVSLCTNVPYGTTQDATVFMFRKWTEASSDFSVTETVPENSGKLGTCFSPSLTPEFIIP